MSKIYCKVTIFKFVKCNSVFPRYASNRVRVRFAPSPTGLLHLGGLRTALYNHLFAKSKNGITILRIEDTDQQRKVDWAVENLINDLAWCGLNFDEGPYFQSERREIYKKYAEQLVDQGDAYYCFCSKTRLDLMRKGALRRGEAMKYDNACRKLSQSEIDSNLRRGETPCIRFKLSRNEDAIKDLVTDPFIYDAASIEGDFVILKADGFPTYHLASVVDDHLMNITHVLRGIEWQISTPKHIQMYKAFKWKQPRFGHFPLLLNKDGSKLSKRQNDISIKQLREEGFFPNAVINFVVRYGGGFDIEQWERDKKIYTFENLMEKFDLKKISKSSSKISLDKLELCNNLEIQRLLETENGTNELVKKFQTVRNDIQENKQIKINLDPEKVRLILDRMKNRINRMEDLFTNDNLFFWEWDNANIRIGKDDCLTVQNILNDLNEVDWKLENLVKFLKDFAEKNNYNLSTLSKLLRKIIFKNQQGPSIAEIFEILGKEEVKLRLQSTVEKNLQNFEMLPKN